MTNQANNTQANNTNNEIADLLGGSKAGRGNSWTKHQIAVAVGMKIAGATSKMISEAFGNTDAGKPVHSAASVVYLLTRRVPSIAEKNGGGTEGLYAYLEVESKQDLLRIAQEYLESTQVANDDDVEQAS